MDGMRRPHLEPRHPRGSWSPTGRTARAASIPKRAVSSRPGASPSSGGSGPTTRLTWWTAPSMLEIFMLGLAVPFGLLPASDPRLVRIAESILRLNSDAQGGSQLLARTTYEPDQAGSSSEHHEVSSLATLWMVRFLIQLGRETGQGRHWTRALAMFEAILGRLSHLGLSLRPSSRGRRDGPSRRLSRRHRLAATLHAHRDACSTWPASITTRWIGRLSLRPVLPGSLAPDRPQAVVRLRRGVLPAPAADRGQGPPPRAQDELGHPVEAAVALTCPDLKELGPWQASASMPEPAFDPRTGRIRMVGQTLRPAPANGAGPGVRDRGRPGKALGPTPLLGNVHGPERGLAQERLVTGLRIAFGRSGIDPDPRMRLRSTTPFSRSCPKSPYRVD